MANLENCTLSNNGKFIETTEYGGDSFVNNSITTQSWYYTNNFGNNVDITLENRVYKMRITPNPGYVVRSWDFTIGGLFPTNPMGSGAPLNPLGGSVATWYEENGGLWVNGDVEQEEIVNWNPDAIVYNTNTPLSTVTLDDSIEAVWISDAKNQTPGQPGNEVIVTVRLKEDFSMPSENKTINIDIDGDAYLYDEDTAITPNENGVDEVPTDWAPIITFDFWKMNAGGPILISPSDLASLTITQAGWQTTPLTEVGYAVVEDYGTLEGYSGQWASANPNNQNYIETLNDNTNVLSVLAPKLGSRYRIIPQNQSISFQSGSGGPLPTGLTWRVNASDGTALQADSTFIDPYTSGTFVIDVNNDITFIPYTSSDNQSPVDLSNVTYTQFDCYTVDVFIPFNPDFIYNYGDQQIQTNIGFTCYTGMFVSDLNSSQLEYCEGSSGSTSTSTSISAPSFGLQ
tara:strand:+ start:1845 stop:3215 length:1371 start_codon:yes stop_codon:yes gene_type:complete